MNCTHCHEPILPGEKTAGHVGCENMHRECLFRCVAGSVGHQKHECSCYGKEDHSEDGMTLRQAACVSLAFYLNQQHKIVNEYFQI